jgi:zinc-binding alcohol dehydrogenase/oxidoreductase
VIGTRGEFKQVLNFMERSQIKPVIDLVHPLKEASIGHRRLEEGKQFGKIFLRMDE